MIETPSGIVGAGSMPRKIRCFTSPADIRLSVADKPVRLETDGDDPHEDHNIGEMYNWVFGSRC
jgi:hypothetical protein